MKIRILGTRGEIKTTLPRYSNHSGVLIDNKLLLDVGERKFLEYKPSWIFITHLHPDHAFFVKRRTKIFTPIYVPEGLEGDYKIIVLRKALKVGKYRVTPIPTIHSLKVKSQGYIIKSKNRLKFEKIFYTGDLISIPQKYFYLLNDLDLVITEASFLREGGMIRKDKKNKKSFGHAGIPNLIKFFKPFTKKILFIHFGSWFYKDLKEAKRKLESLGAKIGVEILVGYDGMGLTIG